MSSKEQMKNEKNEKEQLDSQWDDQSGFFLTPEWFTIREKVLDQVVNFYMEIAALKPEKPDFIQKFCYLQGCMDTLLTTLRSTETKQGRVDPETMRMLDSSRRTGIVNRVKNILSYILRSPENV